MYTVFLGSVNMIGFCAICVYVYMSVLFLFCVDPRKISDDSCGSQLTPESRIKK